MSLEKDIGGLAELDLHRWAKQVNITANRSSEDKEGWDFILEFPPTLELDLPLDQRDLRIECKIQVKGVSKSRKRVGVEVSNLEKMAKSKLPAFYLIIIYTSDNDDPISAYLIHVGDDLITKILRRLRELTSQDPNVKLNKKYMYLTWKKDERIKKLNGKALREAILFHIGDNTAKYTLWKQEIIKNVGNPVSAILKPTIQFSDKDDMYSSLVDLSLGLREDIDTTRTEIQENIRFDIPAKTKSFDGGVLSIRPKPIIDVKLIFRDSGNNIQSEIMGQLYSPFTFFPDGNIPEKHRKLRIVFPFGEIVTDPKNQKADLTISFSNFEQPVAIKELVNLWKIPEVLFKSRNQEGCKLEILTTDGVRISGGDFPPEEIPLFPPEVVNTIASISDYWFVIKTFDFSPEIEVSIIDTEKMHPYTNLIRALFAKQRNVTKITGQLIGSSENVDKLAIPFYREMLIGDKRLLVYGAFTGKMITQDDQMSFMMENPQTLILENKVMLASDEFDRDALMEILYKMITEKGFDYIVFE